MDQTKINNIFLNCAEEVLIQHKRKGTEGPQQYYLGLDNPKT